MALQGRRSKNKGIMDVSAYKDKDFTDQQKRRIINKTLGDLYPQLQTNSHNVCTYNSHLWAEDLVIEIIESFLKKPIDKQWDIFLQGRLERYLTSGMSMAIHSSTSPFYHKYRKPHIAFRQLFDGNSSEYDSGYKYEIEEEGKSVSRKQLWEEMSGIIDKHLDYYDKYLIQKHFFEGLKLRDISAEVNISSATLAKDIKKALHKLKPILESRLND